MGKIKIFEPNSHSENEKPEIMPKHKIKKKLFRSNKQYQILEPTIITVVTILSETTRPRFFWKENANISKTIRVDSEGD